MLVENQSYLTVWIEDSETSEIGNFDNLPEGESPSLQISAQKQSLKKYRGIAYEEGSDSDNLPQGESPPLQKSAQKRPIKKYRGISY
ncbi:MAG: hypothetical protein AB4426_17835 [Xenococcaceae cyanobacterium]